MAKLPAISGRECVRALLKLGFYIDRQAGSHIVLRRDNPLVQIVVPAHRELRKGTLRGILRQAGISVDEFVKLLD